MALTLSRSMSSCALVLAPAGFPPVSAEMNSILRRANVLPFSLRKDAIPCSIWMPPWASGPVLTVKSPIRNGAACAMAGAKRNDAVATAPAAKARRLSLRAIGEPPRELEPHPLSIPVMLMNSTASSTIGFADVKPALAAAPGVGKIVRDVCECSLVARNLARAILTHGDDLACDVRKACLPRTPQA